MVPPIRFVRAPDGVRVAVEVSGTGQYIVFARGWITHLELQRTDPAIEPFFSVIASHRTLVRYDTRGNGLADRDLPAPPDLKSLTSDLEAVVNSLPTTEPIELWGSSYGGPIAINYAASHPEKVDRLILDGTYPRGADIMRPDSAAKFLDMLEMVRSQPTMVFSSLSYITDPDPHVGHDSRVNRLRRAISPETLIDLYRLSFSVDVSHLLPKVTMPTLVLHRSRTRSIPFALGRRLGADLPKGQFVGLEGRAHNLWEEDPDPALSAIGEFLGIEDLALPSADRGSQDPHFQQSMTIIFTDICGSTEMTGRLGDRAGHRVVRAHNRLVRQSLKRFGGREIKHTGDGIMASFRSATWALQAVIEMQRWAREMRRTGEAADLNLRIGLNAGEPVSDEQDLFGAVVQIASRVCDVSTPGQVLVTPVVRALATGKGFQFLDVGKHRLKGLQDPVHLWALVLDPPPAR